MSYHRNPSKKIDIFILAIASSLLAFGFTLFFDFGNAHKLFLFLSPHHSFTPLTILILRSSFLSLGLTGIALVFLLFFCREVLINALLRLKDIKELDFLLLVFGVGFTLRLLWIILFPSQIYSDWKWYDDAAYHMSQIWRYEENGLPTAYWPIGYPLFIAIIYWFFGHSYFMVKFVNVLLSSGICILTYLIARKMVSPISSRLTLLILTFFPSQIFFTNVLASEILFTVLLLLIINFWLKQYLHPSFYYLLLIGILLGLLCLVKAAALPLPIFIALFFIKLREKLNLRLRNALLTVMIAFLTLSPWLLRNKMVIGSFTLATNGGINLYIGNNPLSSGNWVWQAENPFRELSAANEIENNRLGYKLATQFILHNPFGFIQRGIKKEIYLFATDLSAIVKELESAAQNGRVDKFIIFNIIGQVYYYLLLIFSAGGIILLILNRKNRNPGFYLLGGILIYWMGIHFVFFGVDRFHFPMIPILLIFASTFLEFYLNGPLTDRKSGPG